MKGCGFTTSRGSEGRSVVLGPLGSFYETGCSRSMPNSGYFSRATRFSVGKTGISETDGFPKPVAGLGKPSDQKGISIFLTSSGDKVSIT